VISLSKRVRDAIDFAVSKHAGQVDKSGKPYIGHVFAVALRLADEVDDAIIAGLLHDTVEDTDTTLDEIEEKFGADVRYAVDSVTRREPSTGWPKKELYRDFVSRAIADSIGKRVKIADLTDNMSEQRMSQLPESERGIMSRYEKAMKSIQDSIEFYALTTSQGTAAPESALCEFCFDKPSALLRARHLAGYDVKVDGKFVNVTENEAVRGCVNCDNCNPNFVELE
jgi:(p)ppGpp synthase/HD superfamily hydrolase